MEVEMVCQECGKAFMVSAHTFEEHEEDGSLDYCPECTDFLNKEAPPPKRCWEYRICERESTNFDFLGNEGWELVTVDNGLAYFKREYFREA